MITKEQMYHIIDCVVAQAQAAAEKPDPHNLMQLGATLSSLRNGVREMYSTQPATDTDDGWIDWCGGEGPVDGYVEVKYRSGFIDSQRLAVWVSWQDRDIAAYRVVS